MKKIVIILLILASQTSFSQSIQESRKELHKILNKGFQKFRGHKGNIYRIARSENDKLLIYISSDPINFLEDDFLNYESRYVNKLCYITAHLILDGETIVDLIVNHLGYKYVAFVVEMEFRDGVKVERKRYITTENIKKLEIPFRESELLSKLF